MKILVANSQENLHLFNLDLLNFSGRYLSIDLEFNNIQNKFEVALMQLCLNNSNSNSSSNLSTIWIINPETLPLEIKTNLVKIFTSSSIFKIVHGSESLDIPYIYNTFLNNDKLLIQKFTKKLVDTRFLCEYYKLIDDNLKKCTLYDCLLYFNTIDQDTYNDLLTISKKMGKIYRITWDITTISKNNILLQYAYYDVLYLKQLLQDIYKAIIKNAPQLVTTFKYINVVMRYVFLERNNISSITSKVKLEVNKYNNNPKYLNSFNKSIENLEVEDINIDFILKLGYVRNNLIYLFKLIVYSRINNTLNLDLDNILFNSLALNNYNNIIRLLKIFLNNINI